MAGVTGSATRDEAASAESGGAFEQHSASPHLPSEWGQVRALLGMRWQIFTRTLRTNDGRVALAFRIVGRLFVLGVALGAGAVAGFAVFLGLSDTEFAGLVSYVFGGMFVGWQFILLARGSLSHGVEHELLRYPLRFRTYAALWLTSGLTDVWTIIGLMAGIGIALGAWLAQHKAGLDVAVPLLFVAFNVLLSRLLYLSLNRLLARRRTRELVLVLASVLGLLPQMLRLVDKSWWQRVLRIHWPPVLVKAMAWLPSAVAARALARLSSMDLLILLAYAAGAGLLLGVGLLRAYRGEVFDSDTGLASHVGSRRQASVARGDDRSANPVWLVVGVEWRRLRNSSQGLYQMASPLLLVVLFTLRSARGSHGDWMLAAAAGYLALGLRAVNVFGSEGAGVQNYLRLPRPIRVVLLGKNIFAALLFTVQFTAAIVLIAVVHGSVGAAPLLFSVLWSVGYMGVAMRIGNRRSLTAPIALQDSGRVQPGALKRRQRADGGWWMILLMLGAGALGAGIVGTALWLHRGWLAPLLAVPLAVVGVLVYRTGLQDESLGGRIETMEAVLMMSSVAS